MPSRILPPISRKSIFAAENLREKLPSGATDNDAWMRAALHLVQPPHPRERIPDVELIAGSNSFPGSAWERAV